MQSCQARRFTSAFSLIELLVVIAVIALLVSILLPALAEARRAARQAVCMSNLRQFSVGYSTYGQDAKQRIATYSWKPGWIADTPYWDLNPTVLFAVESGEAYRSRAVDQATHIARRRLGRDTLHLPKYDVPPWLPHALFNHLVMNDYLGHALPTKIVACPEDAHVLANQRNGSDGVWWNSAPQPDWRQTVVSSYLTVPAAYAADRAHNGRSTSYPGGFHLEQWSGQQPLGKRKLDEVAFPSQKVCMMDLTARHMRRPMFYAYEDTAQPVLFFDSSVRSIRTRDANVGANPNATPSDPASNGPLEITYEPEAGLGEPPTRSGQSSEKVIARYQWTRGGLKGIDVGGREISK